MAKFAGTQSIVPYPGIRYCRVESVITKEYGDQPFPLITWEDGSVSPSANGYLMYQKALLTSPSQQSSLNHCITAILHMMDYLVVTRKNYSFRSQEEFHSFLSQFGAALLNGTIRTDGTDPTGLFWTGVKGRTVSIYAKWINEYFDYLAQYHDTPHLNPNEVRLVHAGKKFLDLNSNKRERKSLLFHLFARQAQSSGVEKKQRRAQFLTHAPRENKVDLMKSFPMSKAVDLIDDGAVSIRDKMILLLMLFGGGPRGSECAHILQSDVLLHKSLGCLVILDDPRSGRVVGEPDITREEFIRQNYANSSLEDRHLLKNLMPRNKYSNQTASRHKLFSGWKGMTFRPSSHGYLVEHMVHWLIPEAGYYFYRLYQQYMKEYILPGGEFYTPNCKLHPFLFVSTDNKGRKSTLPAGYPLSMAALDKVFQRACNKIGLPSPGKHSARHGYCFYAANVLNTDKSMLSQMLRHGSQSAINAYYELDNYKIYKSLGGTTFESDLQPIQVPDHWIQ